MAYLDVRRRAYQRRGEEGRIVRRCSKIIMMINRSTQRSGPREACLLAGDACGQPSEINVAK